MAYTSSYQRYEFGGYHLTPWIKRLLIANFAIFLVTWVLPGVALYLSFQPSNVIFRPWTIVTYMFVHAGLGHVFFNMLMLFFFGGPVESHWGSRQFIKYYLACGILGGAAFAFLFGFNQHLLGASAAVFGVMLAFAMLWPDAPIYVFGIFPVKAKWLVGFAAAVAFLLTIRPDGSRTAHWAHLGGFIVGYLYIKLDSATGNPMQKLQRMVSKRRMKVIPGQSTKREEPRARRRQEEEMQDELDRVLDKISTHGMASLTAEERRVLEEVSKRYRQN
jgi:membrane associated rhomboid family serine protease